MSVPETAPPPEVAPVGGEASPLLAADLDADGDQEVVVRQLTETDNVAVADERGLLWREPLPEDSLLVGALTSEPTEGEAARLLLVALRYEMPSHVTIAAADVNGITWQTDFPGAFAEINGFAQADGDAADELVITSWSEDYEPTLYTIDGEDGRTISELSSTPNATIGGFYSQVFVTDSPGNSPDQAVFVTPLLPVNAGFLVERLSLADGGEIATSVIANAGFDELYQAPDLTGDGRRDALAFQYGPSSIGVFDGGSASVSWAHAFTPDEGMALLPSPYVIEDTTGDGGSELCIIEYTWPEDDLEMHRDSAAVACYSGATGDELWRESRTVVSENRAVTHVHDRSDLDGDGVIDPILQALERRCEGGIPDFTCETTSFEAVALSGVDGEALWTTKDPSSDEAIWGLTTSNLDGAPGDDGLEEDYSDEEQPDAPFTVRNGGDLAPSWDGTIDTGDLAAYVNGAMGADVDGDGIEEATLTATAYEAVGEEICETYPDGEYCYYEYDEYAFVAAFEHGGELLWQLEL